ncbi:MAG: hypothetical protein KZQ76_04785 [Candidatus Thiodiazotropha sp. (ex Epidulcina cf. delphinae)]|nr:hypothetical protein [Candidatus Thiodiazotropha sp. (ex Epidulcina cf. delphinae)]
MSSSRCRPTGRSTPLQHAFRHAGDFGITGNWNRAKTPCPIWFLEQCGLGLPITHKYFHPLKTTSYKPYP